SSLRRPSSTLEEHIQLASPRRAGGRRARRPRERSSAPTAIDAGPSGGQSTGAPGHRPYGAGRGSSIMTSRPFAAGRAAALLVPLGLAPAPATGGEGASPRGWPSPREMAESLRDLWGEAALKPPGGPSFEVFRDLPPPVRYTNARFRDYPIV